ncbi:MAG TPA: ABC transporter permease [Solirubrobacterales bacterium]|jgi:ABC-type transport system involved in multi-copper enzyme maturation permease subunit
MGRQLKAEWIKAKSLRSTWILLGLALLGIVAEAVTGVVSFRHETPRIQTLNAISGSSLDLVLLTILGVMLAASEYGSKAIISTYTATADRARVIAAKSIVAALLAAAVGALSVPLARVVAAILFGFGVDGHWDAGLGQAIHYGYGTALAYAGFAVIGVVIGTVARSVGIGVGAAFVVIFILDSMLANVSFYAEYALTATSTVLLDPDNSTGRLPGFGGAVALLLIYTGVLVAVAIAVERHRDVGD